MKLLAFLSFFYCTVFCSTNLLYDTIATLTAAFIHGKMQHVGRTDLLLCENNVNDAFLDVFKDQNMDELYCFIEKRMSDLLLISSPQHLLKATFEIDEEEEFFPLIALKVKEHVLDFQTGMQNPGTKLLERTKMIGTQFFLLEYLVEEQARLLSPLLTFTNTLVITYHNLLMMNNVLDANIYVSCMFVNFHCINEIQPIDLIADRLSSHQAFLNVNSIPEERAIEIFKKVGNNRGLLYKFDGNLALFEKILLFPYSTEKVELRLSWSADSDLLHCFDMLLEETDFKDVIIFDEAKTKHESWICFSDQKYLVRVPESLTDFSSRKSSIFMISVKPLLMELGAQRFISFSPRAPLEVSYMNQRLRNLIIHTAYRDLISHLMVLPIPFDVMQQFDIFEDSVRTFMQSLPSYSNFFKTTTIILHIEELLDLDNDWDAKLFFMKNAPNLIASALSLEKSYLTATDFFFFLLKNMKTAISTVMRASENGLEVDDDLKLIATPFFLWKYSSSVCEDEFLAIMPYLKFPPIFAVNIEEDWLKIIPLEPYSVDILLLDMNPKDFDESVSGESIFQWFNVDKMTAVMIQDIEGEKRDMVIHSLHCIYSNQLLFINGAIFFTNEIELFNKVLEIFQETLSYVSFYTMNNDAIALDTVLKCPNLETIALNANEISKGELLNDLYGRFKQNELDRPLKLQISKNPLGFFLRELKEEEILSLNLLTSKNSYSQVSYARLGKDVRFSRAKVACSQ